MAGKSKKQGNRPKPSTPDTSLIGHLGHKSSALSPTDSKLCSQYMVLDHMVAHYKNLNNVKSAIDTAPPKTWIISQKVRDRLRKEAMKKEFIRRNQWTAKNLDSRPPSRDSERDREEILAMMETFSGLDNMDEVDVGLAISGSDSTSQVNHLNRDDVSFVNQMVTDNTQSPSKYHSSKIMKSHIPSSHSKPYNKHVSTSQHAHLTPRSSNKSDLIEKQSHKFTEEKPFTPRTLKSKPEVQSKLSSFKYYNPPKKSVKPSQEGQIPAQRAGSISRASMRSFVSRPETPYPDSVDWMNETIMSRDPHQNITPMGVPPLDISLDADNMLWVKELTQKGWIKEQTRKAQLRMSVRSRSGVGSDVGVSSIRPQHVPEVSNGIHTFNGTQSLTKEDELKYLEFITDVTNDVLDRGIFTNRVLKQVFESHIHKQRQRLNMEKMRELLENLRIDLGIPDDATELDDYGLHTTRATSPDMADPHNGFTPARRRHLSSEDTANRTLPQLNKTGRPPLPRPVSRGSRSRPGSATNRSLQEVKEETEDSSVTFTCSDTGQSSGHRQPDILRIDDHETEEPARDSLEDADDLFDVTPSVQSLQDNDDTLKDTLTEEYSRTMEERAAESADSQENYYEEDFQAETARDDPVVENEEEEEEEEEDDFQLSSTQFSETPREKPKPTPRARVSVSDSMKDTPRSGDLTHTASESVTVSELDPLDDVDF